MALCQMGVIKAGGKKVIQTLSFLQIQYLQLVHPAQAWELYIVVSLSTSLLSKTALSLLGSGF